jgi:FkbM family methyltransferase
MGRVVRYELNALRGRSTTVPFSDDVRIHARKGGNSSGRAVFTRLPDWPEMLVWKDWLRPGDLFVDVGANAGLYTLIAAEAGAEVIAIEPAADMVQLLTENVRLNAFEQVRIHEVAVMDNVGQVSLRGPDANRRVASPTDAGETRATTLDDLVGDAHVRGMKIDVEGNERLVLEGAPQLLSEGRVDLIQLEWNETSESALGEDRDPLASLLHDAGYRLFRFTESADLVAFDLGQTPRFGRDVFAARGSAAAMLTASVWRLSGSQSR